MEKILVIGAGSLIGSKLCEYAKRKNIEITCVYHSLPEGVNEGITWDILGGDLFWTDTLNGKYKSVVVLAWVGNKREERENLELNMKCADKIYDCMKVISRKVKVEQIVLCGSQAEYGCANGIVDEEYQIDKSSVSRYGIAKTYLFEKIKNEKIFNKVLQLRFHSVYGYSKYKDQMIVNVIRKALKNEKIKFNTTCEQHFNYLYVDDAVEIIYKMIEKQCEGIFNIGSAENKKLSEYIEKIVEVTDSKSVIQFGEIIPKEDFIYNVNKLRTTLGYEEKVKFENGINLIVKKIICEE